jgi:hypothetical protein
MIVPGPGSDRLRGGLGRDHLDGGSGSDVIFARDGEPDSLTAETAETWPLSISMT